MTSRRDFLHAAALALTLPSWAEGARVEEPDALFENVSETFISPEWRAAFERVAPNRAGDAAMLQALNARRFKEEAVDRWLTLSAPGVEPFAFEQASALARATNDRLARHIGRSRDGLRGLATIAAGHPNALEEAKRARGLGLSGLSLGLNRGRRLDDPMVELVLAYAASAGLPVYLPASYAPRAGDLPYAAENAAGGAAAESGRHASQLIFSGVLDRHPGLRVILARLGPAAPTVYERLRSVHDLLPPHARPASSVAGYFGDSIRLTNADMGASDLRVARDVLTSAIRVTRSK